MKRVVKRFTSVLLIFTLVMSMASIMSFAAPTVDLTLTSSDDLREYSYSNPLVGSITFVADKWTTLTIPQNGFSGFKNLKSVTFTGEGNVRILPDAFYNNSALEKITFENSGNLDIYRGSFSSCDEVNELSFNVGGYITIWGNRTFSHLNVKELYLPSNMTFKGYYEDPYENYWVNSSDHFDYCKKLEKLVVSCNLSEGNFSQGGNLRSIYFTKEVSEIDRDSVIVSAGSATIYGYSDSAAETFAEARKCKFIPVDSAEFNTITSTQSAYATVGVPSAVTLSVAGFPESLKLESPLCSEVIFNREDAEIVTSETGELWTVNLIPMSEADTYTVTADYGLADLCATDEITIFAEEDTTPPVISVETATPAVMGEYAKVNVNVKGSPEAIRFVDDNVTTIAREDAVITENDDNTETWEVNLLVNQNEQQLTVYAKDETGWLTQGTAFTFKAKVIDYSTEISDFAFEESLDGVIYNGMNEITLTTANGISKVQFMKNGNTWTYTEDSAEVIEIDGRKYWTIRMNFWTLGDQSYDIRVRTPKTTFEFSQKLDVTVYSR